MAATATDLTTDATVSAELGISAGGTVVPRLILVASDAIRAYLNRNPLHYSASITEKVRGFGRPRIILQRLPVISIASIAVDGSTVDSTEYEVEDDGAGLVFREYGWPWSALRRQGIVYDPVPGSERRSITVVYAGGWVTPGQEALSLGVRTLPYDIEQACIETCVSLYRRRGQDGSIASESLGAASVSYALGRGGVIPDTALALLNQWRVIR